MAGNEQDSSESSKESELAFYFMVKTISYDNSITQDILNLIAQDILYPF